METIDFNSRWFVVLTRPRAEKQVAARFMRLGITHYLALRRDLRTWRNRRQWVEMPLFPAYIFVYVRPEARMQVFDAFGVVRFVSVGGQIAVLRPSEIDRVKRLCETLSPGEEEKTNGALAPGDVVEITNGPFQGKKGEIAAMPSGKYLEIRLEELEISGTIKIPPAEVEKY